MFLLRHKPCLLRLFCNMSRTSLLRHAFYISLATRLLCLSFNIRPSSVSLFRHTPLFYVSFLRHKPCLLCLSFDIGLSSISLFCDINHVFYISFSCYIFYISLAACRVGLSLFRHRSLFHVSLAPRLCLSCAVSSISLLRHSSLFFVSLVCFDLYVSLALCLWSKCLFRCANETCTDARRCARESHKTWRKRD